MLKSAIHLFPWPHKIKTAPDSCRKVRSKVVRLTNLSYVRTLCGTCLASLMTDTSLAIESAQGFIEFVNASPTPYHAVNSVKNILKQHDFEELSERDAWSIKSLKPSGKYFVTRNASSLIAFTVGGKHSETGAFAIVGAHTDSPCLRIKPISNRVSEGFIQIGVEQYGGILAHTWFDRDLSIAGRVYVNIDGTFVPKLLKIDRPLLRIPTLAIHLNRESGNKFEFNKETQLLPIAGQVSVDEKQHPKSCKDDPELQMSEEQFTSIQSVITRHNKSLVELIAKELECTVDQIEDFELLLYDHQKSVIGGLNGEFIFSPRLDNLTSCYCAAEAIVKSVDTLDTSTGINLISLFDHEEIGSRSAQGADSSFLPDILKRLSTPDTYYASAAKSFLLSSDMAHGVHPNYSEKYEGKNKPEINKGPVIKINANQRYSTNSPGIVLLKQAAQLAKVPLQLFVVRNDAPCGSTIGPILASKLGIRTLDLGNPQLSMHSIRETGGTFDVIELIKLFGSFFANYHELESKIHCDGQ